MAEYGPEAYGEAFADVYDEWYADVSDVDALAATVAAMAGAGRVLELGIGSGRLALPIAARGVRVAGIDASPAMVANLRAKPGGDAIPVAIGDMADVDVAALVDGGGDGSAQFAVVLIAYNTVFNLASADAQRRCIARSAAVLGPGGRLVVEAVVPDTDPPVSAVEARSVEVDRVTLNVSRREPIGGAVNGQLVEITTDGIKLRPWRVRPVGPDELDGFAAEAGLRLVERWSHWDGTPFVEGDVAHISVYAAG